MRPITVTIPASAGGQAGVANYSVTGRYFLAEAIDAPFVVETDTGKRVNIDYAGKAFGDSTSPIFRKLTFYNSSGSAINVTFYASMETVHTPESSVTNQITASASITNTLTLCALETENQIQVSYTGTPVQFAAAGSYYRRMIIIAQKSLSRTANTGNVYIGIGATNQPITLAPGTVWTLEADTGGKRDAGSWYMSADNNGDGITILYV